MGYVCLLGISFHPVLLLLLLVLVVLVVVLYFRHLSSNLFKKTTMVLSFFSRIQRPFGGLEVLARREVSHERVDLQRCSPRRAHSLLRVAYLKRFRTPRRY